MLPCGCTAALALRIGTAPVCAAHLTITGLQLASALLCKRWQQLGPHRCLPRAFQQRAQRRQADLRSTHGLISPDHSRDRMPYSRTLSQHHLSTSQPEFGAQQLYASQPQLQSSSATQPHQHRTPDMRDQTGTGRCTGAFAGGLADPGPALRHSEPGLPECPQLQRPGRPRSPSQSSSAAKQPAAADTHCHRVWLSCTGMTPSA